MVRVRIRDEEKTLSWEEWETHVRRGRVPPDAQVQFEPVTGDDFRPAIELEMYRSLRNEAMLAWEGQFRSGGRGGPPPILTALLVGVQVRIYLFSHVPWIEQGLVENFTNWTAPALEDGQTWRLLTMGVLHTEVFHITLNMIWLAYTGWNLERALGRANLAVLYLVSVIGGSLFSALMSPWVPSLGASGGIFGLVAASVVFGFVRLDVLPEHGRRLFGMAMLPYLVIMFASGLTNPGTDNWAHFGGLVTGGALAFLLDPVPVQRRPRWNLRIQTAALALSGLLLVGLGLGGPRIYPLYDADYARMRGVRKAVAASGGVQLKDNDDDYKPVEWAVPGGWRPNYNIAGDSGFRSPLSERSFAVSTRKMDRPTDPQGLMERWQEKVRRSWPEATFSEPRPVQVHGHAGVAVRASDDGKVLDYRGTTRGLWAYWDVWGVDAASEARLRPLRDRLRSRTIWRDPEPLYSARLQAEYLPNSLRSRIDMARALGEVGDAEAAKQEWLGLIERRPQDAELWIGLLELGRWYPETLDEPLLERALTTPDSAKVVAEVAATLDAWDRTDDARGLLEIAWMRWPGDRHIRGGRRRLGMTTGLDQTRSWSLSWDPVRWAPRDDADREARTSLPLTLAGASTLGGWLADEQRILSGTAVAGLGDDAVIRPLLALRRGRPPEKPVDAVRGLRETLDTVAAGRPVHWMPTPLYDAIASDPATPIATLDRLLADPAQIERLTAAGTSEGSPPP